MSHTPPAPLVLVPPGEDLDETFGLKPRRNEGDADRILMPSHEHNWPHPRVAVGSGVWTADDVATVLRAGITHVIDCRSTASELLYRGTPVVYFWCPTDDDGQPKPAAWFRRGVSFGLAALAQPGTKVLAHCFPPGTMVDAPVPVPIERVGETVTGHDGAEHAVLERMERPFKGELVVVHATGALPLRCTPEHPLLVLKPYRNSSGWAYKPTWKAHFDALAAHNARMEPEWIEAAQAQPGDFLLCPLPRAPEGPPAPVPFPFYTDHANAKAVGRALPPSRDVAWMLGLYASEGSASENSVQFTLSPTDDVPRLVRALREVGVEAVVSPQPTYQRVHAHSRTLARSFRAWFGESSREKRLPPFVFDGWDPAAVLAGLIEGDGSPDRSGWVYSSTSLALAFQTRRLALLAGWEPTIREFKRRSGYPNAAPMYQVGARRSGQHHTCRWRDYYCMPIRSVEREAYDGPVHNLEVADVHTYVANGAVAHNCAAGINRGPSMCYALLRAMGLGPTEAERAIRRVRPFATMRYRPDAERAHAGGR